MTTVPLGQSAYKRTYSGEPEIKLVNRFLEKNPTNLKEHVALLSRPGEASLASFAGGLNRGSASFTGLFGSDLFVVFGTSLYRFSAATGEVIPVTGTVANNGFVYFSWMKGPGYEFLFISDGQTLWYYNTHAIGTLTAAAGGASITDVAGGGIIINIGGVFYAWSASVDSGAPAGTVANPYRALLGTASAGVTQDQASLANMVLLLNFTGNPGIDFSTAIVAPSVNVTATSDATKLYLTAVPDLAAGNLIATLVQSGAGAAFGAATLTGGGNQILQAIALPGATEVPASLTALSSSVLVAVGASQKAYFLLPGSVVLDPLNFFSKESHPDNITSMTTVGDQAIICGVGSTENWYATGNADAPFLPVDGRVYQRGCLAGTECAVGDALFLVGNDGVVYSIGYGYGETAQYGVHRVSTHAIEERIRVQMRILQGLPA